jgi:hypothetical protein
MISQFTQVKNQTFSFHFLLSVIITSRNECGKSEVRVRRQRSCIHMVHAFGHPCKLSIYKQTRKECVFHRLSLLSGFPFRWLKLQAYKKEFPSLQYVYIYSTSHIQHIIVIQNYLWIWSNGWCFRKCMPCFWNSFCHNNTQVTLLQIQPKMYLYLLVRNHS